MGYNATAYGEIIINSKVEQKTMQKLHDIILREFDCFYSEYNSSDGETWLLFNMNSRYYEDGISECLLKVKNLIGNSIRSGIVEFSGEDGESWRFHFRNGNWYEDQGHIEYEESDIPLKNEV